MKYSTVHKSAEERSPGRNWSRDASVSVASADSTAGCCCWRRRPMLKWSASRDDGRYLLRWSIFFRS